MNDLELYKSFSYCKPTFQNEKYNGAEGSFSPLSCNFFAKMLEGEGVLITDEGETLHLTEGDYFFLPRGIRYHSHWIPSTSGNKVVQWQSVRFDYVPTSSGKNYYMQKLPRIPSLDELFAVLDCTNNFDLSCVGRLYLCFSELQGTLLEKEADPREVLFEKAKSYMMEHPDFKVSELAKYCMMSESGLYAFFSSYVGVTPVEMKNRICMDKAILLLESTDLHVEEVAIRAGFKSISYFRKLFLAHTGKKPTEFRKEAFHIKYV